MHERSPWRHFEIELVSFKRIDVRGLPVLAAHFGKAVLAKRQAMESALPVQLPWVGE